MTTKLSHSDTEWSTLCKTVKEAIPSPIGHDAWEVVIAAALITSPQPELLGQFYSYLAHTDPRYNGEGERNRLSLRLRDTLLKSVTLVGAPQVLCALMPLAEAEGHPEDKARESHLTSKWQNIDVTQYTERGEKTIDTIYGDLFPQVFQSWGSHSRDFQFNMHFGIYGLYLSDNEVMTPIETEAVVFTAISCLGLRRPSLWHMRGMGRLLGARGDDDEADGVRNAKNMLRRLKVGVMFIVEWVGEDYMKQAKLDQWPNVGDVSRDLGGWGDDAVE